MRLSTEHKTLLGFGAAVVVLAAIGFISYQSTTRLVETSELVAKTQEVLTESEAVLYNVLSAESSVRGYVVTGEPALLTPYGA